MSMICIRGKVSLRRHNQIVDKDPFPEHLDRENILKKVKKGNSKNIKY